jgi:hypothetical protein
MSDKKKTPTSNQGGVRYWLYIAFLSIAYKVFHLKDNDGHNGWFVKKNPIIMVLLSPMLLPFFMLYGIVLYWDWATNWYYSWVEGEKRDLTFKEKLAIKHRLVK